MKRPGLETLHDDGLNDPPASELLTSRVDAIASKVEELVGVIVNFREELEASGAVLPQWQSYRLAAVLSRVDHAAAEIVIQQARRIEADGQLAAFEELAEWEGPQA